MAPKRSRNTQDLEDAFIKVSFESDTSASESSTFSDHKDPMYGPWFEHGLCQNSWMSISLISIGTRIRQVYWPNRFRVRFFRHTYLGRWCLQPVVKCCYSPRALPKSFNHSIYQLKSSFFSWCPHPTCFAFRIGVEPLLSSPRQSHGSFARNVGRLYSVWVIPSCLGCKSFISYYLLMHYWNLETEIWLCALRCQGGLIVMLDKIHE